MNNNKLLLLVIGILSAGLFIQSYRQFKERSSYELGERLNILAHYPASADSALSAQLIVAELKLIDPKELQVAKSMLEELATQNIKQDTKIRAQLILARHIRDSDPEYAKKLFNEVAQQTLNINEQLVAKFFIAGQLIVQEPNQARLLLESILNKAKEINKDLYARIILDLAVLLKDSDPLRSQTLLEEAREQDFNLLGKEYAEKALKMAQ